MAAAQLHAAQLHVLAQLHVHVHVHVLLAKAAAIANKYVAMLNATLATLMTEAKTSQIVLTANVICSYASKARSESLALLLFKR